MSTALAKSTGGAGKSITHRTEKGLTFDAESNYAYFSRAILTFRVFSGAVYRQNQEVQSSLPEDIKTQLLALEQQIYQGPNATASPDQCAHPILAFFGLNTSEISPAVWLSYCFLSNNNDCLLIFSLMHPGKNGLTWAK
jgi:hypothetical protein